MAAERRRNAADDLMTSLVRAEIDGSGLTDFEIAAFFVLLAVAGNDTTRQTTTHALKALTDSPGQRKWLLEDFDNRIPKAIDEFIRWASPVMTFRRTVAVDERSTMMSVFSVRATSPRWLLPYQNSHQSGRTQRRDYAGQAIGYGAHDRDV
jgi:cytochrome P450